MKKILCTLAISLALCGCYSKTTRVAEFDVPYDILENTANEAGQDPLFESTDWIPEEWWLMFDDPQLNCFIHTAFEQNPSLQAAHARILFAQTDANKIRASFYPSLSGNGDVQRLKLSKNSPFVPSTALGSAAMASPVLLPPSTPLNLTQYETYLNLTYEFDFWGKNKNTFMAALDAVQARYAEAVFAKLTLGIATCEAYFKLLIDYERQKTLRELVQNRKDYFEMVEERERRHLENGIAVLRAKNDLIEARERLIQLEADTKANEHLLKALLSGKFDEEINESLISQRPLPKVPLPLELPLHLIAHRPDIIAQLWLIESAGKLIEVAKAGFYPDINLLGIIGYQSKSIQTLFNSASGFGNIMPSFTLPIFQGGRILANLRGAEVDYDLAILQYNQLILDATQQVLDGISYVQSFNKISQELLLESQNRQEIADLTTLRVDNNLSSNLDSINALEQVLAIRDRALIATGNTLHAILGLIKALGGGYNACE